MTQMMIKSPAGSSGPYITTAKAFNTYFPDYHRYYRSDMWPSDNGSLFTFAGFFRLPDQATYLNNRIFLGGLNNWLTLFFRQWDNFVDAGSQTNRFLSYIRNATSGNGWAAFQLDNPTSGLNMDDWFAFMLSIDYSGAVPVVETWTHKKGDAAAINVGGGLELDADTGPITFEWDDTSVVTSVGSHPSYLGDAGEYDACEIYITNEAVDWSVEANRLKFVDNTGKPVGLGSDGSDLTGTAAKHYAPDGDLTNNLGTESNWTENGTIPGASTSPSD